MMMEVHDDGQRQVTDPDVDPIEALTGRDNDILQLLAARLSNEEIAAVLGISSETVRRHSRAIYRKLMLGMGRAAVDRARALGAPAPAPPGVMAPFADASRETEGGKPRVPTRYKE